MLWYWNYFLGHIDSCRRRHAVHEGTLQQVLQSEAVSLAACLSGRALARQEVCGRLEKLPLEESRMIKRFNFDLKFVKSIC